MTISSVRLEACLLLRVNTSYRIRQKCTPSCSIDEETLQGSVGLDMYIDTKSLTQHSNPAVIGKAVAVSGSLRTCIYMTSIGEGCMKISAQARRWTAERLDGIAQGDDDPLSEASLLQTSIR